ncbi:hypothetical protein L484_021435 [Morus notabilis]|uniref:Uncharacterized protein n=1 Tax=Morus notabilis TaxID=981085 RepID=W9RXJ6_9ROSA|nr:hypothetical protein L484_021435 [Morus notabilis]
MKEMYTVLPSLNNHVGDKELGVQQWRKGSVLLWVAKKRWGEREDKEEGRRRGVREKRLT